MINARRGLGYRQMLMIGLLGIAAIGVRSRLASAADVVAPRPPATLQKPVKETLHGREITDDYQWLEDQQSPATRAWIEEQNAYTDAVLARAPGRDILRAEATALLRTDSIGMPVKRQSRYFFARRNRDQDQYVLYVRDGWDGKDEVLIDPHPLSDDSTTSVSYLDIAEDGSLVIYGVREGGEDEVAVHLLEVATRKTLPDQLPKGRYFGIELLPDKSGFYYTRHSDQGSRVFFHALGSDPADDPEIFGKGYGPGEIISADLSDDGRYLLMTVFFGSAADKTELYLLDRSNQDRITTVFADVQARVTAQFAGARLLLLSNREAANGELLVADANQPSQESWQLLVPKGKQPIESVTAAAGHIYVNYLDNAQSIVRVFDANGKFVREVQFDVPGTIGAVRGQWEEKEVFFDFSSFVVPSTIYGLDESSGERMVWAQVEVPIDSAAYDVTQAWFPSKDGTQVPMFLVCRKGQLQAGSNLPTLMTGYGGFNISLTPRFSATAALWVMQGGLYVVPNLRGGGEFGEEWHRGGMLANKQNVFDDFIAAAEYLIREKYTSAERLAIAGRSNGGLLVGAAITQRPDLYRAAICGYPLLDMIRYHRFLVARFWVPEYGSSEDKAQFQSLLQYSPYHRVEKGEKYPAVLFITGDADTRVDPLHARKMAALLQEANGSSQPILLRYDTKAGHSTGKPLRQAIEDLAEEMTFLCWQLGVTPTPADTPQSHAAQRLHQLFQDEWEYALEHRPTYASYLGDKRYNDRWPDVSPAAYQRHYEHVRQVLKEADAIEVRELDHLDQEHLRLFRRHLQDALEEEKYGEHLLPIDQRGGIQTADEVADAIAFESIKDYEDWIKRLEAFPEYVAQTIGLMREGIRTGRVHPKIIMERIPEQLNKQLVSDPERSPFFKPFERMAAAVPENERQRLRESAKQAITTKVLPALVGFKEFFEKEYFPASYERVGIWQFPSGPQMYASVAKRFTTTNLSPDEIHKLGQREVQRIRGEMETIIKEVGFPGSFAEFLQHLRTDPKFYYGSSEELLEAYQALSKRIDPTLVKLFRKLPRMPYGVEPIPMPIAPDTTTAYYRGPAADGSRAGTYFVNLFRPETRPKYEMEALSLHEAVPGHHLQIALAMELGELPPFRRHGGYTAFVEGWGLYAESLGGELGFYQDPYSKFGQLTYEMWRAVRLVVDTGMHHLAWSREQAIEFFKTNAAKSELDITNEIDRYIAWPGQALAYKIGELKIKELRARATVSLGDAFDVRAFHEVVLGSGAVPLDLLEANVDRWIEAEKKRLASESR